MIKGTKESKRGRKEGEGKPAIKLHIKSIYTSEFFKQNGFSLHHGLARSCT
jgi:hypothetical protein